MNADIKAKWVAALRSGEYEQGRRELKDEAKRFCCLGVLCDLHSQTSGDQWTDGGLYLNEGGLLPERVRAWAGLDSRYGGTVSISRQKKALSTHNDLGCSFSQIAKAIEEQL